MSQVTDIPSAGYAASESYALITGYDIYDRDYYKKLIKKVPRAAALQWMKAVKGYMSKRTTIRSTYYYHEEGQWMSAAATIAAVTDNTTYATITLSSADHTGSGTQSFPVVGQTVLFENEVCGYVKVVTRSVASAHTVDVYPVDTTNYNIIAAAQVGTTMVFYSNAQQEESTATETRLPRTNKVTNYVQTFREGYKVTDTAMQNQTEFAYNGQKFLYVKGIDDTVDRFAMQEELGMLINPASSGLTNAGAKTIQLAKGLIPQITDNGNTLEYFGTPDMTTIDDAILILNRSYGENEYVLGQGLNINLGWKNWLIDFAKGGDNNISFSAFDGGGQQAVKLNFKTIGIEPYTFHMQTWAVMAHADTLGAGNMPYKDMAVFIPMGTTRNAMEEVGAQGDSNEPYLQIVYSDPGGAPNQNKGDHCMFSTGALAPGGATTDGMFWHVHMVSYKSLEVRCRNKFLILRKAA
jgi:hypothetical protein